MTVLIILFNLHITNRLQKGRLGELLYVFILVKLTSKAVGSIKVLWLFLQIIFLTCITASSQLIIFLFCFKVLDVTVIFLLPLDL